MRRPRHREKSNLVWKMIGVAALVNAILWPVLIRLGLFNGIRQEVLIPVSLIAAPPPNKLPDTLQKISRQVIPAPPSHPSVTRLAAVRPASVVRLNTSTTKAPGAKKVQSAQAVSSHPNTKALAVRPVVVLGQLPFKMPDSRFIEHPKAVAKVPSHKPLPNVATDQSNRRVQTWSEIQAGVAARRARAAILEAQGHEVAVWIAQQRTAHPSLVAERSIPAAVIAKPPGPIPVTTKAPDSDPVPAVPDKFVPAVLVSQVSPTIPASLQSSAWHAKFQGRFTINKDGSVKVVMISSTGFPALDKRTLEAARHWKFRPATSNGVPIESTRGFVIDYAVRSTP